MEGATELVLENARKCFHVMLVRYIEFILLAQFHSAARARPQRPSHLPESSANRTKVESVPTGTHITVVNSEKVQRGRVKCG